MERPPIAIASQPRVLAVFNIGPTRSSDSKTDVWSIALEGERATAAATNREGESVQQQGQCCIVTMVTGKQALGVH